MTLLLRILTIAGSALFMVVFFGLCVFVHELGHFLAARLCGLHVQAFSIGFKKIWAKKINGVEYRIGCIPFGGYVDLPQIDATGEAADENGPPLPKAAPWKRIVTASAGPLFNIFFAMLLGCVIWFAGLPQSSPKMQEFKVISVQEGKPEYLAGLRPGDVICRFNGKKFNRTWNEFVHDIMLNVGDVRLTVRRGRETREIVYKPIVNRQVSPSAKIPFPFFTVRIPVSVVPQPGSPAEKAGLKEGDLILRLNGQEVGLEDFATLVALSGGKDILLEYSRMENGKNQTGTVTVHPEPEKDQVLGVGLSTSEELLLESVYPGLPVSEKLRPGDRILSINGKALTKNTELFEEVASCKGKSMAITVLRNGKEQTFSIMPVPLRKIGVTFRFLAYPNPLEQLENVLVLTWKSLKSVSAGLGRKMGLNTGYTTLGPQHFSGPVGIGEVLYLSVYRGSLIIGLNFVVLISFSLGLFNLLPIPVLDGGHILLALLELLFRKPVSAKILQPVTLFFVVILIGFMIFVTFFDIQRLLPQEAEKQGRILTETNDAREVKNELKSIPAKTEKPEN